MCGFYAHTWAQKKRKILLFTQLKLSVELPPSIWVESSCSARMSTAPPATTHAALLEAGSPFYCGSLSRKNWCFWSLFLYSEHGLRHAMVRRPKFCLPFSARWIPSLAVTFSSSASLAGMFSIGAQAVVQQASITLKSVIPLCTRFLIKAFLSLMKSDSNPDSKPGSFTLVQWLASPQQRENRYLGSGGIMIQGFVPFAFSIGSTLVTIFF